MLGLFNSAISILIIVIIDDDAFIIVCTVVIDVRRVRKKTPDLMTGQAPIRPVTELRCALQQLSPSSLYLFPYGNVWENCMETHGSKNCMRVLGGVKTSVTA